MIRHISFMIGLALMIIMSQAQTRHNQFVRLEPAHTHIDFNNTLKDTKEDNILIYSNFYGGAGVGIGDINNDGLQDVFFAGNQVADRLYLNKGNLVFEDITEKAGIINNGGWSSGVLIGDVNGDGFQDIYVTRELYDNNPDLRRNKLYINNGDETFTECASRYGLDDSERTRHATFLDFDKDGDLDVFLLNQPPNPGDFSPFRSSELLKEQYSPRLMMNQGDQFIDVTRQSGLLKAGFPNSVSASDLDNDGWTDLFVANDFWVRDFIYMNNGDGTFTDKAFDMTKHMAFSSMGVDAADLDNNGWLDVFVLDMVAEGNYRRKSNMSGMPKDAFMRVVRENGHYQYMYNMLYMNRGDGLLSEIAQYSNVDATDWSWSVLLADFDNDGWKDVFITNGLMRDIRNNDAAHNFQKNIEQKVNRYLLNNPNAGDVSLWNIVDIEEAMQASPSVKLRNYMYRNRGDFTFDDVSDEWGLGEKTFSNGSAYADLDNDGDLDLIISNINDLALVYENKADSINENNYIRILPVADRKGVTPLNTKIRIEYQGGKQYFEITSVRGMYSTSEYFAHFGLGKFGITERIVVEWPDGKKNIFRNQKANQTIRAFYSKASNSPVERVEKPDPLFVDITEQIGLIIKHNENNFDDFERQIMLPHKFSDRSPCFAVGDVNGDGLDDIFMGGVVNTEGRIFKQNTDGSFGVIPFPDSKSDKKSEDIDALFFDVENDGDLDLYVVSGGNEYPAGAREYQDRLYINDGVGNLTKSENLIPPIRTSGGKVRGADFDNDGDSDLLVTGMHIPWKYPSPATTVLLKNEGGKFVDVTAQAAKELINIGLVYDAAWVDYNLDGLLDIALAGEWMPFTLFRNTGTQFINETNKLGLDGTTGWWRSIAFADMDNDGDEDFVLGNFGANYEYRPAGNKPFHAFYYDFDINGTDDLVLAYHERDRIFPVREKDRSARQVPFIGMKFKSYHDFAKADIFEIYGEENISNALHCEANTFSSAYVENQGGRAFVFHQLPWQAQVSPINDIMLDDFNLDGHQDILAAGNQFGVEVETVRPDAGTGVLLVGDGMGNFSHVDQRISGVVLPDDIKNLTSFHYRDQKVIVVGSNNGFYRMLLYDQVTGEVPTTK